MATKTIADMMNWTYPGNRRATMGEFFATYVNLSSKTKVEALHNYCNENPMGAIGMRAVVESLFHPQITYMLQKGAPSYRSAERPDTAPNSFNKISRSLHYFIEGAEGNIKDGIKRDRKFFECLEAVSSIDAAVLIAIKDKDAAYLGITAEEAVLAFPQWLPLKTQIEAMKAASEPKTIVQQTEVVKEKKKPGPKPKAKNPNV